MIATEPTPRRRAFRLDPWLRPPLVLDDLVPGLMATICRDVRGARYAYPPRARRTPATIVSAEVLDRGILLEVRCEMNGTITLFSSAWSPMVVRGKSARPLARQRFPTSALGWRLVVGERIAPREGRPR